MERVAPQENADRLVANLGYTGALAYADEQETAWMRHADRIGEPGLPDVRYWCDVRHEVEHLIALAGDPEPEPPEWWNEAGPSAALPATEET